MGMDAATTTVAPLSGRMGVDRPRHVGLAQLVGQRRVDGGLRCVLHGSPRGQPRRVTGLRRLDRRSQPFVDVAVMELGGHPRRVGPLAPGVDDDDPRPFVRAPGDVLAKAFESHGDPRSSTVWGRGGSVRTMASAAAMVPG